MLIVIEGAYSMDSDIAPVPEFVKLKEEYGCFLMVDEARSTCVIGKTGGGVDEYFNLEPGDIDIKMGTLSRARHCGGYGRQPRASLPALTCRASCSRWASRRPGRGHWRPSA